MAGTSKNEESKSVTNTTDKVGVLDAVSGCNTLRMSGEDFGITI